METFILTALATAAVVAGASAADAAQGCGPGFHRGYYDRCITNRIPAFYSAPRIGIFYPGQGYWYGGRYWGQRYGWHGGWRYR